MRLLVDSIRRGWRDSNGSMTKTTVEAKILLVLNKQLGCNKNYKHYMNRMKSLRKEYNSYAELFRCSSGFGWDPITKRFTAPDEAWKEYFKHISYGGDGCCWSSVSKLKKAYHGSNILLNVHFVDHSQTLENNTYKSILREKAGLQDTRFISVEEMFAIFMLTVGQNSRYCLVKDTFKRSKFAISTSFNLVLEALLVIAPSQMVKPDGFVPMKI
ncbi:hypothetical protein F2Q69_00029575 [Brassica cretica]|uniref:Myb/SANT-like domain-containing protein n=1 Tax=Brassica cretica TaxID=69181 RepID=A0A8S9RUY2_BRACR|nr:hypothetical protein F2Q69_00029575 [Brassica cretica]